MIMREIHDKLDYEDNLALKIICFLFSVYLLVPDIRDTIALSIAMSFGSMQHNFYGSEMTLDILAGHELWFSAFPRWLFVATFQLIFGWILIIVSIFSLIKNAFRPTHQVATILMILDFYQSLVLLALSYFLMFTADDPQDLFLNMVALNVFVNLDDEIIKTYSIGKNKATAKEALLIYFENDEEDEEMGGDSTSDPMKSNVLKRVPH